MREIFTYGSVGGALGNQCFYPETSNIEHRRAKINPKPWESRESGRKLVDVTQWVRVERSNSHLAKG